MMSDFIIATRTKKFFHAAFATEGQTEGGCLVAAYVAKRKPTYSNR
jgi:hypothetical protein